MAEPTLCQFCGWGSQIKPSCTNHDMAFECDLNHENVRKFMLRNKHWSRARIVKSIRYQGPDGKGDSFEKLEVIL